MHPYRRHLLHQLLAEQDRFHCRGQVQVTTQTVLFGTGVLICPLHIYVLSMYGMILCGDRIQNKDMLVAIIVLRTEENYEYEEADKVSGQCWQPS